MKISLFCSCPKPTAGSALLVVLAFMVILTVLVLAFFSRALLEGQISTSSANHVKIDVFAQGCVDTLTSALKQEIAAGSNATTPATGVTIYTPKTSLNAVPALSLPAGAMSGTNPQTGLENLVKESAYGISFSSGSTYPTPANSSTATPSLNGRLMTPERWNKPLLLGLSSAGSTTYTPVAAFANNLPNWILVTRNGGNPTAWNSNLIAQPNSATSTTAVIGRYAYCIYDEGGLLDMNAAGFHPPSTSPASPSTANYKNALAFADLTQIGLTQPQIDTLVGWRNYASAGSPSGAFPSYTWTDTNANNYFNYILANSTGFLKTANATVTSNNQTDQIFTSRQQLLNFVLQGMGGSSDAGLQTALQCMGTFSRDLNQPSYAPNPNRPKIVGDYTAGGNDGSGEDALLNPAFLSVRAASTFTRNDQSKAVVGEPLVKKRFALSRLAWLTYLGPSASRNLSSPSGPNDADINSLENTYGITQAFLEQGTAANIQAYFGLTWNNGSFWVYNPTSGGSGNILKLSEVAALNPGREPNFIELLKAAILAGSIAKDYPNELNDNLSNFRYTSVNCSVLQIAANIIDQADCDGYPTHIQFTSNGNTIDIYGVENLPYFYRVRTACLLDQAPVTSPTDPTNQQSFAGSIVNNQVGEFKELQEPEVWNPHAWNPNDPTSNYGMGNPRPTSFQLVASSIVPGVANSSISVGTWDGFPHSFTTSPPLNSTLSFNVNSTSQGAGLFREPTLLITPGIPLNSNLHGTDGVTALGVPLAYNGKFPTGISAATNQSLFTGFVLGLGPACYQNGSSVYNFNQADNLLGGTGRYLNVISYTLSCNSPSGGLISYDRKIGNTIPNLTRYLSWVDFSRAAAPTYSGFVDTTVEAGAYLDTMIACTPTASVTDPRTARFGLQFNQSGGDNYTPAPRHDSVYSSMARWICPNQNVVESDRPDNYSGYLMALNNGDVTTFPPSNSAGWYWANNFAHGMAAQNQESLMIDGYAFYTDPGYQNSFSPSVQYYADADGVVRRGMAAYLTQVPGGPASTSAIGQPLAIATLFNGATGQGTPIPTTSVAIPAGDANLMSVKNPNQSYMSTIPTSSGTINARPIVLNRPFRSTGELGYVFSDTPWKNLDLFTPESGNVGLLDVFCVNDTTDPEGLVAGKVDLNTRQTKVLQAVLAGAYEDEYANGLLPPLTPTLAAAAASALTTRTSSTSASMGPLSNVSELVGKSLFTSAPTGSAIDGSSTANFIGYSSDLGSIGGPIDFTNTERVREAPIRALAQVGTTRVWNLMIDLVVQTGFYPKTAQTADQFLVEGEARYWVHLAVDRATGKVIDEQVEMVKE